MFSRTRVPASTSTAALSLIARPAAVNNVKVLLRERAAAAATSLLRRRQNISTNNRPIRRTFSSPFNPSSTTVPSIALSVPESKMDVRAHTFDEALPGIIEAINNAAFVAIDFEFSGVSRIPGSAGRKQTIQERYNQDRIGVEKYQALQLGLCCVERSEEENKFVLRPYTFPINPYISKTAWKIEREFTVQASAMSFLSQNGFDMNVMFKEGIPYLSIAEEEKIREQEEKLVTGGYEDIRVDSDTVEFVDDAIRAIKEWNDDPSPEYDFLNIADKNNHINGYQKRLVHQIIRNQFPGLASEGRGTFVQITKQDEEARLAKLESKRARITKDIESAKGLRKVFDALRGNAKMLVGHNVLIDLMHLYKAFVGPLPHTIQEFAAMVHKDFPCVVDTKYVASSYGSVSSAATSLQVLDETLRRLDFPYAVAHPEHEAYIGTSCAHDAGFDTWQTATVLLKLLNIYRNHRKTAVGESESEVHASAMTKLASFVNMQGKGEPVQGANEFPGPEDPLWRPFMNVLRMNGTEEGLLRLDAPILISKGDTAGVEADEKEIEEGGVMLT